MPNTGFTLPDSGAEQNPGLENRDPGLSDNYEEKSQCLFSNLRPDNGQLFEFQ